MGENRKIDKDMYRVERATLLNAEKSAGAKVVADSEKVYAVDCEGALFCMADSLSAVKTAINISDFIGKKKVVLFLKEQDSSCGCPFTAYAYLDAMPTLPSGKSEIKRLAPSLAQTVADASGISFDRISRLMRDSGVYGAIVGGTLAGFIGQTEIGGIDLYRVYDESKTPDIGKELTLFLTTLVMTYGRLPFATVGRDEEQRSSILKQCGFTAGKLFAYLL